MTAKEKILTLIKDINYAYNDCTMYETIKKLLEEMEKEPSWIPCSERFPDNDIDVVISTYEELIYIASRHIGGSWQTDDNYLYDDEEILAWLPLPEPYKGETND